MGKTTTKGNMKNKSLKKTLSNIFVTLLSLCLLCALFFFIIYKSQPPKIKKPKYTVGTIVNFKQGTKSSGLNAVVKFRVNGKVYKNEIGSSKYCANVIGEKYKVTYESNNPSKNIMLIYNPLFAEYENKSYCTGKITRIFLVGWSSNKYRSNYGVEFNYIISGVKFTKEQLLPKGYKNTHPNLKEGNTYKVVYWILNPKRSIIYLDSSINEP